MRGIPRTLAGVLVEHVTLGPRACWTWTGALDADGYGTMRRTGGGTEPAHRYVYREMVGAIPEGLHLDHLCARRTCVNPAHLEPVTPAVNVRRALLGRRNTHCRRGHVYEDGLGSRAKRYCRACHALRQARKQAAA